MSRYAALICLPLLLASPASAADLLNRAGGANVVVEGNTGAVRCSTHARMAADGMMSPAEAVATCTDSLNLEPLSLRDKSATYTNRGVLYMTMSGLPAARADFDAAIALDPDLSEPYINRGAILLAMGDYAGGLADLDRGIALGDLKEPWKVYFNRGIAHENLNQARAAYEDYSKAAELKPDWDAPKTELARFVVKR